MHDTTGSTAGVTYQIGEVANRIGLSQRTIRHYDDLNIVKPSARTVGGFRLYTDADVERFLLIKPFKPLGIGLEAVRALTAALDVLDDPDADIGARRAAREQVERTLLEIAERRQELDEALAASEATVEHLHRAMAASLDVLPAAP